MLDEVIWFCPYTAIARLIFGVAPHDLVDPKSAQHHEASKATDNQTLIRSAVIYQLPFKNGANTTSYLPCALRMKSQTSRAAPRPPYVSVTKSTRRRTSAWPFGTLAANPANNSTGRSMTSSPIKPHQVWLTGVVPRSVPRRHGVYHGCLVEYA